MHPESPRITIFSVFFMGGMLYVVVPDGLPGGRGCLRSTGSGSSARFCKDVREKATLRANEYCAPDIFIECK